MRARSYRLGNVVAASLLAVLAAALTLVYVSRASTHATPAGSTTVLVATRDIPVGTGAAQIWSRVAPTPVAANDVVSGAITDQAALRGRIAIQPVYAGEQLTARRLGPADRQGVRAGLNGTQRIVELPGDPHQLLVGTLRAGDHVDVVASIRNPESGSSHSARVVLRNLLVVDTPAGSSGSSLGSGGNDASVDLQLSDEQAQRLFWVEKNADWTLALRPAEGAAATDTAPATSASVLAGDHGR